MALTWGNENENDSKPAILVKAVQRDFRRMSERYPKININAVDIDKMAEKMNSLEGCAEYQETDCSQDVCGNKVNELICVDSNNEYHYRFDGTPRHPDFSACYNISNVQGMVKNMLGTDHKPVYQKASKGALCKASFDMWFNDDAYYNKSETQYLVFVKDDKGYKYSTLEGKQVEEQTDYMYSHILMDYHKNSNDNPDGTLRKLSRWDYHPLDYRGFHKEIDFSPQGTECSWGDKCENDAFTSEITGYIQLTKDEKRVYEAHSDDDSWVFINDRLVIDNGGRHGVVKSYYDLNENVVEVTLDDMYNKSVPVKYYKDIDAFEGGIYPIKVFYADRNGGSDLHLVIPDLIDPSIVKCQTGTDSDAVEQ